jgi:hypothetical protein
MSDNVVILSGSPRKDGSTERLVREFAAKCGREPDMTGSQFRDLL